MTEETVRAPRLKPASSDPRVTELTPVHGLNGGVDYYTVSQFPLDEFELSVHSRNCMVKMNIRTLGDLVKKTESLTP